MHSKQFPHDKWVLCSALIIFATGPIEFGPVIIDPTISTTKGTKLLSVLTDHSGNG